MLRKHKRANHEHNGEPNTRVKDAIVSVNDCGGTLCSVAIASRNKDALKRVIELIKKQVDTVEDVSA